MPDKRMFVHDYTRVGFYMITILTAARHRLFGECRDSRVCLSPTGELVQKRWHEIPMHQSAIETNTLVVMPDHVHGIVYVKEQLPKPVGASIRGFKSGATSAVRDLLGDPALEVWEDGYHDRVIMNADTLRAERDYIRDNPRRYCVRQAHPDFFVKVDLLESPRLPLGMAWEGFGNRFLLEKPELMPVHVSRQASAHEVAELRARRSHHHLARRSFPADALPISDTDIGPGSLALFLGSEPGFSPETVWFEPCIADCERPELLPPLRFDEANKWWQVTKAILNACAELGRGNYLVGCPDLIENVDILASLRGTQNLLMDMVERPAWVEQKVAEINHVWCDVYQRIYDIIKLSDGSSAFGAFRLWGPGKTAKVGDDGAWQVVLDPMPACSTGRTITVTCLSRLPGADHLSPVTFRMSSWATYGCSVGRAIWSLSFPNLKAAPSKSSPPTSRRYACSRSRSKTGRTSSVPSPVNTSGSIFLENTSGRATGMSARLRRWARCRG